MVVEVMGQRLRLDRALRLACVGDRLGVILIPGDPVPHREAPGEKIMAAQAAGWHFSIVVCAEAALPGRGEMTVVEAARPARGSAAGRHRGEAPREIEQRTARGSRSLVPGHLQRGGTPTSFDRPPSLRFGARRGAPAEEGRRGTARTLGETRPR